MQVPAGLLDADMTLGHHSWSFIFRLEQEGKSTWKRGQGIGRAELTPVHLPKRLLWNVRVPEEFSDTDGEEMVKGCHCHLLILGIIMKMSWAGQCLKLCTPTNCVQSFRSSQTKAE